MHHCTDTALVHSDQPHQFHCLLQTASGGSQFALTQFGLSAFVWSETEHMYRPRTFNFYVFPRPANGYERRFLSQVRLLMCVLPWGAFGLLPYLFAYDIVVIPLDCPDLAEGPTMVA